MRCHWQHFVAHTERLPTIGSGNQRGQRTWCLQRKHRITTLVAIK
jgi:hypothetical protein